MRLIKNFESLASTDLRIKALKIAEAGLLAIQPKRVLSSELRITNNELWIRDNKLNLDNYERIFLVGFGKGSGEISKYLENLLGDRLTAGWDIDLVDEIFKKIHYVKGTHPLPSQTNIDFTQKVVSSLSKLSENDLVLVVICGGGSAMFEKLAIPLNKLEKLNQQLLVSGATIEEMNIVRKHVSKVKGGRFAEILYPSSVVSLIFSDVPGNDLSTIASGPTVMDTHTKNDAIKIMEKYNLDMISSKELTDLPKNEKYFKNVQNILVVSNKTALLAMEERAKQFGLRVRILTDRLEGNAKELGNTLISQTQKGEALLAGGESTMKVTGNGKGGRNQALVLASLPHIKNGTIIVAFGSDGVDFYGYAGALADKKTIEKANELGINPKEYLELDDSFHFWEKVHDGIDTGTLESNVSDLYIVINE